MQEKKLRERIIDIIAAKGHIPVDEYMGMALEHYYSSRIPIGRAGDFTTAPEVSQMFGEMIAVWFIDMWQKMGRPQHVNMVELGPGRGTLMCDILRVAKNYPDFNNALEVFLVEISPELIREQWKNLSEYDVKWYGNFEDIPEGFTFVIANEFFDALPIKQFVMTEQGWRERVIVYDAKSDKFELGLSSDKAEYDMPAPPDSIKEKSDVVITIAQTIAERLSKCSGAGLFIDYGYNNDAFGDTIQAVKSHNYVDWLENPGECDITAHVNFAALKFALKNAVNIHGAATQGDFLKSLGIEVRCAALASSVSPDEKIELEKDMQRLISPSQMGELFKVMAIVSKDYSAAKPEGFI